MARTRNIRPQFFTSETVAELSIETRLAFIGLWTIATWNGVVENRPKRIKYQLFPYDTVDITACLDELESNGFIVRYEAICEGESRKLIYIKNFTKYQIISGKEQSTPTPFPVPSQFVPSSFPVLDREQPGNDPVSQVLDNQILGNGRRETGGKTTLQPPTLDEALQYGSGKGYAPEVVEYWYAHRAANDWTDAKGVRILAPIAWQRDLDKWHAKDKRDGKVKAQFPRPTVEQVIDYGMLKGYPEDLCVKFHAHYSAMDWKINGQPIVAWRPKLTEWCMNGSNGGGAYANA